MGGGFVLSSEIDVVSLIAVSTEVEANETLAAADASGSDETDWLLPAMLSGSKRNIVTDGPSGFSSATCGSSEDYVVVREFLAI